MTETEFEILDHRKFCAQEVNGVWTETVEFKAIHEWLKFHNLFDRPIPIESEIRLDFSTHMIYFDEYERDDKGKFKTYVDDEGHLCVEEFESFEQGEAGPLPFPAELFENGGSPARKVE